MCGGVGWGVVVEYGGGGEGVGGSVGLCRMVCWGLGVYGVDGVGLSRLV